MKSTAPIDDLLKGLNPSQAEAVRFKDGPLLVLAGPGSGKTRVVTHRIAALLRQGIPGWRIVALTFTNKAASEMKNRVEVLSPGSRVWLGTFHSFCAKLLRNYGSFVGLTSNFTIYDTDQSRQLLDRLVKGHTLPNGVDPGKIANSISWAKNGMVRPEEYIPSPGNLLGDSVRDFYPQYQNALLEANAVDFDDLLLSTATLLRTNPALRSDLDARFEYILVDEYQDTNLVQYAIVRALSIDHPNLGVTGDPDQSIYGWRGASIRNILEFEKNFRNVTVIRLEQNYRSTPEILAAASCLIKHNKLRKDKELIAERPSGKMVRVMTCRDQLDETDRIASEIAREVAAGKRRPGDYAVFYRMNALSRNLEHAFHRAGVPFQLIRGLEFFGRREVRDLLAWFQLLYNPNDTVAFRRIINLPPRGIGVVTIARLEEYAKAHRRTLPEATREADRIPRLTARAKAALKKFGELLDRLTESLDNDLEVLLSILIRESNYLSLFDGDTEEDKERQANVQELLSEVREFDQLCRNEEQENEEAVNDPSDPLGEQADQSRLGRFLERTALVSDVDALDSGADRVCLMSLHAAKGLEFPVVYLIALEDSILPHERSVSNPSQIEEERRLLFVGMTRARDELRLSHVRRREFRGFTVAAISSRFLFELPSDAIHYLDAEEEDDDVNQDNVNQDDVNQDGKSSRETGYLSDFLAETAPTRSRQDRPGRFDGQELRFDQEEEAQEEEALEGDEESRDEESRDEDWSPKPQRGRKKSRRASRHQPESAEPESVEPESADDSLHVEYDEEAIQDQEISGEENGVARSSLSRPKKARAPFVLPGHLIKTAAELTGAASPRQGVPPSQLTPGTLVRHKSYGIGTITNVSGPSDNRIVCITFVTGIGTIDLPASDPELSLIRSR